METHTHTHTHTHKHIHTYTHTHTHTQRERERGSSVLKYALWGEEMRGSKAAEHTVVHMHASTEWPYHESSDTSG